jgi:two-component sensor histidine kinase
MASPPYLVRALQHTRTLPWPLRYAASLAVVAAIFGMGHALAPSVPLGYPFSHLLLGILVSAALFDHGTGFFATGVATALAAWFHLSPAGSLEVAGSHDQVALLLFALIGVTMTIVIESLHRTVQCLQDTHGELRRTEHARVLLLREFRHRTRNDLGSLVGLLMLRARTAPSAAAREALREAADHALALSRVHARLALDEGLDHGTERATIDTRDFVTGLCTDITAAAFGEGLRPVRLSTSAESHHLSAERAVPLGLVLNETVTNALKYAFPEDRAGTVTVTFARHGADYVLTVLDDGIGVPPEGELEDAPPAAPARGAGLGTRLLRALAAQLRGSLTRQPGPGGVGTLVELRFAAAEPGAGPAAAAGG